MSSHLTSGVIALKTLSLVMGGLITYFAYKAYRRTDSRALRALTVGFGVVTFGAIVAGVLDQFFVGQNTRDVALIVESALTTLGFGVILYSLYAE